MNNLLRQIGPDGLIYQATKTPDGGFVSLSHCGISRGWER